MVQVTCRNRSDICRARLFIKYFTDEVFAYVVCKDPDDRPPIYLRAVDLCYIAGNDVDLCLHVFKKAADSFEEAFPQHQTYCSMDFREKNKFRANLENELFNMFYETKKE